MTETYVAYDCQGLAGAWTLGTAMTERFTIEGRASLPGGFGDSALEANRGLIPGGWEQQEGTEATWEDPGRGAAFVHGTPPCSGFSVLNVSKQGNARGPDADINSCMRDLAAYGGRVVGADGTRGAEIISFESVQGAYKEGRGLMNELRRVIERNSGQRYALTHVKMSGSTIGAAQMRHRYYPVFHRVPFGVERPDPHPVVTVADAIDDLRGLDYTNPEEQPYGGPVAPSEWARPRLREDGRVDWHVSFDDQANKAVLLLDEIIGDWAPGEGFKHVVKRIPPNPKIIERFGRLNEDNWTDPPGWGWPRRIHGDKPGYVITGNSMTAFVHYTEPRFLTIRELSRLMGYPDAWVWPGGMPLRQVYPLIGKCCPVDSGRWISEWIARSLDGEPGTDYEVLHDGEYEYLHDCTLDYTRWPEEVSGFNPKTKVVTRTREPAISG